MAHELKFYINGAWGKPVGKATLDVIDPSTEEPFATIALRSERRSGSGREYADFGLDEFLEIKGTVGYEAA